MTRLHFRKIGTWKENNERGFYVEAVDIPRGEPRYLQISLSMLDADSPLQPQETESEGVLSFLVDREELLARIS